MTRVVHGSSRSSAAFRTREEVGKATAFFIYPTFSSLSLPYLERRCLCIQIPITRSTSFGSSLAFFLASLRERVALTSPTLSLSLSGHALLFCFFISAFPQSLNTNTLEGASSRIKH